MRPRPSTGDPRCPHCWSRTPQRPTNTDCDPRTDPDQDHSPKQKVTHSGLGLRCRRHTQGINLPYSPTRSSPTSHPSPSSAFSFIPHPHLESPGQKLIFHLQKVPLIGFSFKWLIDNGKLSIILDVLPSCVAMAADEGRELSRKLTGLDWAVNTSAFWPDLPKVWHYSPFPACGLLLCNAPLSRLREPFFPLYLY